MNAAGNPRQTALLVIAHPDDETMFFAPTLQVLRTQYNWHILCLSTGVATCAAYACAEQKCRDCAAPT